MLYCCAWPYLRYIHVCIHRMFIRYNVDRLYMVCVTPLPFKLYIPCCGFEVVLAFRDLQLHNIQYWCI